METFLSIIYLIVGLTVFFFLMYKLFGVIERYTGMRVTSKYDTGASRHIHESNIISKAAVEQENKRNPVLVNFAVQKVKDKKYAMTYQNVWDEIEKIKKDKALMTLMEQHSKPTKVDPYEEVSELHRLLNDLTKRK